MRGHLGSDWHSFPRAIAAFRCTSVLFASPAACRSSISTISVPSRLLAVPSNSRQWAKHRAAFPNTVSSQLVPSNLRKVDSSVWNDKWGKNWKYIHQLQALKSLHLNIYIKPSNIIHKLMKALFKVMLTCQSFLTFIRIQQLLSCQMTGSSTHCQCLNGILGGRLPRSLCRQEQKTSIRLKEHNFVFKTYTIAKSMKQNGSMVELTHIIFTFTFFTSRFSCHIYLLF